jgi:hypothetical protein
MAFSEPNCLSQIRYVCWYIFSLSFHLTGRMSVNRIPTFWSSVSKTQHNLLWHVRMSDDVSCFHTRSYYEVNRNVSNVALISTLSPQKTKNWTPWPESASELYRPSDRLLSAKLVPTFADRGVSRSQRGGSPTAVILYPQKTNKMKSTVSLTVGYSLGIYWPESEAHIHLLL